MTDAQVRCAACNAILPIAKSSALAWTSGLAVTGLGLAATKSFWGRVFVAAVGIATIAVVDQLARPVCGDCRVAE